MTTATDFTPGMMLEGGLGSKDRRAAIVAAILKDRPHGNSVEGRYLARILTDAATIYAARIARKAVKAGASESAVVETIERPAAAAAAAPVKAAKTRKVTGKAAAAPSRRAKAAKVAEAAGSVPCLACFGQTPFATAKVYPEGYVCPQCEADAAE